MPRDGLDLPDATDDVALRRRLLEEGWEAEARAARGLAGVGGSVLVLAWISDVVMLGPTPLAFTLLGLRLLGALMLMPLLRSSFAERPPRTLARDRLLLVAVSINILMLIVLHPTTLAADGWGMVATWTLLALGAKAELRPTMALLGSTYVAFLAHLWWVLADRGEAYGEASQIVAVVVCGGLASLLAPWMVRRSEAHRLRELASRLRLEQEVELRQRREREAREAEARADRSAEQAQRESRLRTELFANVSHDLRTPMAGILGIVELMRDTSLTDEQAGYIETIRASNQTLLSLLDDVIDFGRIEEGKLPIVRVAAPLAETLRRPADLLRVTAERKGLRLHVDLPGSLPAHVLIDPARVQQILLNLLGNAVKFTQRGQVTMRAELRDHDGRHVLRVEVEDSGIGFTEQQRERLFQRFVQAEDATAQRFGGSGLGLSICKGLVELMDGRIGAEHGIDGGALFWFEIPAQEARGPAISDEQDALPHLRVLLAEDNAVNQLVVSTMLKKLGQTVTLANDGGQALELLLQDRFDLAIVDMQMPVMDGSELTRRVREASPARECRIVALTAAAEADKHAQFREAGVDAVYTKPIDLIRLRRLIREEGAAVRTAS